MSAEQPLPWQKGRYIGACIFLGALLLAALAGLATWPSAHHGAEDGSFFGDPTGVPAASAEVPRGLVVRAVRTSSTAPSPGRALEEARLLDRASAEIERRDGAAALQILDGYVGQFPAGTLSRNERTLRVQALMILDRRPLALQVLDRMALERTDTRLLTLRGELRLEERRFADALADFGLVLSGPPDLSLGERALYGRARCREGLGDKAAARADLQLYLERYPTGWRVAEIKKELGR